MAPATSAATPATRTWFLVAPDAATPTIRLAVETMPSLAPRIAARSQPIRCTRWRSGRCFCCVMGRNPVLRRAIAFAMPAPSRRTTISLVRSSPGRYREGLRRQPAPPEHDDYCPRQPLTLTPPVLLPAGRIPWQRRQRAGRRLRQAPEGSAFRSDRENHPRGCAVARRDCDTHRHVSP